MSSPYTPLGYQSDPPPWTFGAGTSAFDIKGIADQIARAASSLKPGEHGSLILQATEVGAGAGLIVRGPKVGPVSTEALAVIVMPKAGRFTWSASVRASFLKGGAADPPPVRFFPKFRGLYRLMRTLGNGRFEAAAVAFALTRGIPVAVNVEVP